MEIIPISRDTLAMLLAFQSEVLSVEGLSLVTGWAKSYIYKLTSAGTIPYYKPNGKTIFFKKSEVEEFLLRNRQNSQEEIEANAVNQVHINKIK